MRRRRHKYLPIIAGLGVILFLFMVVTLIKNLRVFVVYSSGVGPFLFVGLIVVVMVALFVKGLKF